MIWVFAVGNHSVTITDIFFFFFALLSIPFNSRLWHLWVFFFPPPLFGACQGQYFPVKYSRRHYSSLLVILGVSLKDAVYACLCSYCLWNTSFFEVHFKC